jgi:hypothetical protein
VYTGYTYTLGIWIQLDVYPLVATGLYVLCLIQSNFSDDVRVGQGILVLHPFTPNKALDVELLGRKESPNKEKKTKNRLN